MGRLPRTRDDEKTPVPYVATSLDGYIARDDGAYDFFVEKGDHADEYWDVLEGYDAVVMGRETYRIGEDAGVSDPYPKLKTYVCSQSMDPISHPNVELVSGDPVHFVRELKQTEGADIYLCGGGKLAGTLFKANLIDDLILKVNPVMIGSGIPAIRMDDTTARLELKAHKIYESGVVLLHYTFKH